MNTFLLYTCCFIAAIAVVSASAVHVPHFVGKIDQPWYAFNYAVRDPHSNDNKAQWETRDGDIVKGSYSLAEPDGTTRIVDYTADNLRGFNAVVKKIGPSIHPPPVPKTVAPLTTYVGPVSYGFGATPIVANLPKLTPRGQWSLPWIPFTHSYGGWVPIASSPLIEKPFVTIHSKQFDHNGNLHKWITGPIPLRRSILIIKKRH